ncbi:MAG: ion channel [Lentimicrobium sp.]
MVKQHYKKALAWIERKRFLLLLLSTLLTLVLPAFSGSGILSEIIFVTAISFLFIQSMIVANVRKSRKLLLRGVVIIMILLTSIKPAGYDSSYIEVIKLSFFATFFIFVISYLTRFISRSTSVNVNVLITSINVYLLGGIVGASLALALYRIYPDAYNFPANIDHPVFVHFLYYSYITMSTVGYGDITPRIPETQTLAYLISISGQLYVAIIIAFLIGKLLMQNDHKAEDKRSEMNE